MVFQAKSIKIKIKEKKNKIRIEKEVEGGEGEEEQGRGRERRLDVIRRTGTALLAMTYSKQSSGGILARCLSR